MRILKDNDYKLFEQIVSLKQPTLLNTMRSYLKKHYKKVICTKDYVLAEGDIPVALVAHLDTVFKDSPDAVYYDTRKNVMWSPQGLGADDRAGVYAIIRIIKEGLRPHIIFTTDEEIGGLGADEVIKAYPQPFADMKYIIELDRRGTNDCVFYDCNNEDFTKYVESFGFIENWGTYSDICEICPVWKVAGVNLSIGYQNEHSPSETLHINPFLATIDKVINMLNKAKEAPYFKYIPSPYAYNWRTVYKNNDLGWSGAETDFDDGVVNCAKCKNTFSDYEVFPVKSLNGTTQFYCPDCIASSNVDWCYACSEAYESAIPITEDSSHLCQDCERRGEEWKASQKSKNNLKKL